MRLNKKTALVTAAAAGIGRATVAQFVAEGAEVLAVDINQEGLDSLKAEHPNILTANLDVTNTSAVNDLINATEPFDILFNCAGFVADGDLLSCTEDVWDFSFELNVKAMFLLTKAVLPGMLRQGRGSIINMSSVAGVSAAPVNRFAYCASKAAVAGMTKSIAADYVKQGIRCNAICPGTVATPSLEDRLNAFADPEQARKDFIARQPMGRLGEATEIAALATYLASDESDYTTGVTHIIDGGWSNG
ncbi:MAG: SDR family oxidoreductase [Pseudomonadales bacterium]